MTLKQKRKELAALNRIWERRNYYITKWLTQFYEDRVTVKVLINGAKSGCITSKLRKTKEPGKFKVKEDVLEFIIWTDTFVNINVSTTGQIVIEAYE